MDKAGYILSIIGGVIIAFKKQLCILFYGTWHFPGMELFQGIGIIILIIGVVLITKFVIDKKIKTSK